MMGLSLRAAAALLPAAVGRGSAGPHKLLNELS